MGDNYEIVDGKITINDGPPITFGRFVENYGRGSETTAADLLAANLGISRDQVINELSKVHALDSGSPETKLPTTKVDLQYRKTRHNATTTGM